MKIVPSELQGQSASAVCSSQEMPAITAEQQVNGLLRAFVALRHRNYRLFWFGQLISLTGTWMQTTGQAWLVLQLTGSAWALGLVGALQFLPIMVFALFGGVLADRWPKRRVLLFTQSCAMFQASILCALVVSNTVQIWHVYILALMLGMTNAFDMPTRQAFVVEMVGREDLPNAVALNSSIFNMARIVGPGLGGILIAVFGGSVAPLFMLNALSFVAVIVGLAMINVKELHALVRTRGERTSAKTWQSLGEGLSYVWKTPSVLLVIAVLGIVSLFGINFNVALPLVSTTILHAGSEGFGFLSSAFGIGSLASALWLAWGNKSPSIKRFLIGSLAFCLLLMLFSISRIYGLSLILIALVGFSQIAFSALANTTVQTVAPDHLRGRVMSVYMVVFAGTTPIGNLLIGGLAHAYNVSIALLVCAVLSLVAALAGWVWRKPAERDLAHTAISDAFQ